MTFQALIPLIVLLVLIFIGVPVAFSLGLAGVMGLYMVGGTTAVLGICQVTAYRDIATFSLSTVPLYLLMAEFIVQAKLADPLFECANRLMGRLPGGVGIATVWANAFFGAISGSSTAAAATMGKIAYPAMRKLGYTEEFASGIITTGGTLAILIPPSIAMVVYGLATETSISALFKAGIVPGLLMSLLYSIFIAVKCITKGEGQRGQKYTWKEKWEAIVPVWPVLVLIFIVVGFLEIGIATATEVGAVGAFAALIIGLSLKKLKWDGIKKAIMSALKGTAMIQTIMLGAKIFGYYFTLSNFTQKMCTAVQEAGIGKYGLLAFAFIVYFFLGMIMNNTAILCLTLPITFPLMMQAGFNPVWFGIFCTICGEIGLVTPPVGLNSYMVAEACGVDMTKVFKGGTPMLIVPIVFLILMVVYPPIAMIGA